ncbi:hypothetical protein [Streptomyces sp. NPDC048142]|uniref:hypothetical protein n=1 Tax=Streptomyces sp. NPDC048142 TaxID=3365501 RepID=UPI003717FC06
MPFAPDRIHCDLLCGAGADGRRRGWYVVRMHTDALRGLGLHPDQPTAVITGPPPPRWWHAAAERNAYRHVAG